MAAAFDTPTPSTPSLDDSGRLFRQADRAESRIRRRFLALVAQARGRLTPRQISTLLRDGNIPEIMAMVEDIGPSTSSQVEDAFIAAAIASALAMRGSVDRFVDFDPSNPFAAAELAEIRQIHGTRINNASQNMLTEVIADGFDRDLSNRQLSEEIIASIGLSLVGFAAVRKFRKLLENGSSQALSRELRDKRFDATIARAVRNRTPLTAAQIKRMTDRYRENQIRARAKTIGISSGNAAVHAGDAEMFRQAIGLAVFTEEDVDQEWLTRRDNAVRISHRSMHEQGRPFGVPFLSGAGNLLRYPGDLRAPFRDRIRCRCGLRRLLKKNRRS